MVDLKQIRTENGMTQEQLAEDSGVIRQTISNIECGLAKPSIETAKKIGKALDFDWANFFRD